MTGADLLDLPVAELANGVRSGRVPVEAPFAAVTAAAERLEAAGVGAFVARHADVDAAVRGADALGGAVGGRRRAARGVGPLAGVPIALGDDLCDLALPTACGAALLADYRSPFEATAVARLLDAGALVVGKTNMDAFGLGTSTQDSVHGPTRHPADPARLAGGAAGGAAAAVAAGVVRAAIAGDSGGALRHPAALCGVVAVRPTYGRVSRHGLVSHAGSLDQVAICAQTVEDAMQLLAVVAGRDPFDATSVDLEVPDYDDARRAWARTGVRPLEGVRVACPTFGRESSAAPVVAAMARVRERLRALGASVKEISLPHAAHALAAYVTIAHAEAASALGRYRALARRDDAPLGHAAERALLLGTALLAGERHDRDYRRAQAVRALVATDLATAFDDHDLILTPTSDTTDVAPGARGDPYEDWTSYRHTAAASLAGLPALTLPVARDGTRTVGAHLMAPHFAEPLLFRAAIALERGLKGTDTP